MSGSAAQQEADSGMDAVADAAQFYAVYPEGLPALAHPAGVVRPLTAPMAYPVGTIRGWRAGPTGCPSGTADSTDDVTFALAIIDDLAHLLPSAFDTKRVYATGFSNGGFMAYRLGCEQPNRFAAIASVGGSFDVGTTSCTTPTPSTRRVPLVQFQGTADPYIPIGGSAERTVEAGAA